MNEVTDEPDGRRRRARSWIAGLSVAGFILSIGLSGGGYELPASGEIVILASWLLLVGAIMGVVPDARPTGPRAAAAACLLGLVVWSLISIGWSDAAGRSVAVAVQYAAILSVLLLGTLVFRDYDRDSVLAGVLGGAALVAGFAVASRFHPELAPKPSAITEQAGMTARLHWPVGYWNTLGFLAAMVVPLGLHFASAARSLALRALAGATLPVLALCVLFTLSRGSILIVAIGVALGVVLSPFTINRLIVLAVSAAASGFVVAEAVSRKQLMDALTSSGVGATQAGDIEFLTIASMGVVAAVAAGMGLLPDRLREPKRDPRFLIRGTACVVVGAVVVIGFFAAGGGPRLDRAWNDFRSTEFAVKSDRANSLERLTAQGSNGRWQLWQGAVDQGNARPISGDGAGTFEIWWNQHTSRHIVVRNAHSQYLEVYGELGLIGVLLMLGFVISLIAGCVAALRRGGADTGAAAAGSATVVSFLVSLAFDWGWQVTVVPAVAVLAFAAIAAVRRPQGQVGEAPAAWRAAAGVLAVLMLALSVPPVVATLALTQSQREAKAARLGPSLAQAKAAVEWQPYSASAWLQRGLVYDSLGLTSQARKSVLGAIEREPDGWRNWLALSAVEARAGNVKASLAAYRRARDLNPTSPLFATGN